MTQRMAGCELCEQAGGRIVWQDAACRVVRVDEPDYPDYCRVVWNDHVAEMSDLSSAERRHVHSVVFALETALRQLGQPDKINLASLGNLVAHVHWHVIPRYRDDRHFPRPIWALPLRDRSAPRAPVDDAALRATLIQTLAEEQAGAA